MCPAARRNRTDDWFIYDLYEAFNGREPDPSGWAAWEAGVSSQGRAANVYGFSSSGNGEWVARANAQYAAAVAAQSQDGGSVNWLVSDHLGTPRMVVDETGNLSGVKRHDYLPFGEEIGSAWTRQVRKSLRLQRMTSTTREPPFLNRGAHDAGRSVDISVQPNRVVTFARLLPDRL